MKDLTTVELVAETLKRIQMGDCHLVSTKELNALIGSLEMEVLNRWADQVSESTVEMD